MISVYKLNCGKCHSKAHVQRMKLENINVFYFENSKKKKKKERISESKYKKRRVVPPNEHFGCHF